MLDYSHLPLEVLRSAAGFYIGRFCQEVGPIERVSARYWKTKEEAEAALKSGNWPTR